MVSNLWLFVLVGDRITVGSHQSRHNAGHWRNQEYTIRDYLIGITIGPQVAAGRYKHTATNAQTLTTERVAMRGWIRGSYH